MSTEDLQDWAVKCPGGLCGIGGAEPFEKGYDSSSFKDEEEMISIRSECRMAKADAVILADQEVKEEDNTDGEGDGETPVEGGETPVVPEPEEKTEETDEQENTEG